KRYLDTFGQLHLERVIKEQNLGSTKFIDPGGGSVGRLARHRCKTQTEIERLDVADLPPQIELALEQEPSTTGLAAARRAVEKQSIGAVLPIQNCAQPVRLRQQRGLSVPVARR